MKREMSTKPYILGCALILGAFVVSSCGALSPQPDQGEEVALANPASVFCEERGYTLEIRTGADGGQVVGNSAGDVGHGATSRYASAAPQPSISKLTMA